MISAPRGKHARHHHNPQDQGMVLTIPRPTISRVRCTSVLWFVQLESESSILASKLSSKD